MTLEEFGFNAQRLVAGFSGGVVHALVFKQTEPMGIVASVLAGALTANFLTPVVSRYIGDWIDSGAGAFIVGLTAMTLCQGVVAMAAARIKTLDGRDRSKAAPP